MKEQRRITHIGHNGPEAIKKEIEQTRKNMGDTIEEIKERLSAHYLTERVKEAAIGKTKDMIETTAAHTREWSESVRQNAKSHPAWYAAAGAGAGGLVWLLMRHSHHDGGQGRDSVQSVDRSTQHVPGQTRWNESAAPVEQKTGNVESRVPQRAQRNLLFLGVVAFLTGAIAGFMMPASKWEGEWVRKARDVIGEAGKGIL
jgi:hypothetical protein